MSYSETISYNAAGSLSFDATLVEVASSTLRLKDLGGATYSLTNPKVTTQHQNTLSSLTSFSEVSTKPSNTEITYQLVLNGNPYFWNTVTSLWTLSDGTYVESSTASVINAAVGTLFSDLSLLTPQFLSLNIFLHTSVTGSRPVLTSNTIVYAWTNSAASAISNCMLTGYLSDLVGNGAGLTLPSYVKLQISCDRGFFHGNHFVRPFTKTFTFDANGYVSASVIETATPGVKLGFSIVYDDGISTYSSKLYSEIVPNQPQADLSTISTLIPYNFG